ncbi:MAG: tRNA (adenine-N1)-methyltransferase [Nitrospirae bacterium]|nr:tRNA (adenine-N1)-methyltransferase [Candidatus Troglogloeales bacterium]
MVKFVSGEIVHLVTSDEKEYRLALKFGASFKFSGETLLHNDVIGQEDGVQVSLSRGTRFFVFRPTLSQYMRKMPRGAQILYPKDIALITMWADIYPGAKVLEAGIGSGALTLALLKAVSEKGQVISYDIREDFVSRAIKNIKEYVSESEFNRLTVRQHDIYEGIIEDTVDRIVLDLPEPYKVVPHAAQKLRSGGIFLSFVPTVPQMERVVEALRNEAKFDFIETFETLLRPWNIEGRSVRPQLRMVAHSGFLICARRVSRISEKACTICEDTENSF